MQWLPSLVKKVCHLEFARLEDLRKIPLQGVYHRLRVWLNFQHSRGLEPRPAKIRTRCELELATEIGTQRALQRVAPDKFQGYDLDAAKHRLQFLHRFDFPKNGAVENRIGDSDPEVLPGRGDPGIRNFNFFS